MNHIEYISARLAGASLSLLLGYFLVAILPGFIPGLGQASLGIVGKFAFVIAAIQFIGMGGLWFSEVKQKRFAIILNILSIGLVAAYCIVSAPNGAL